MSMTRPISGIRHTKASLACAIVGGLSAVAALCFFAGTGEAAAQQKEGSQTVKAHRAVVADAGSSRLRVVDLETGKVLVNAELASPARLTASEGRRYVFAAQSAAGEVRVIDTGIHIDDHGDHADLEVSPPRILPPVLKGPKPSHINSGGGRIAVFFDGDGTVKVITEEGFARGDLARAETVATGVAHHGVAKPIGAALAVSTPKQGENLPIAIALHQGAAEIQSVDCPRLHGEGKSGRFTAFGCADGIALFEETASSVTARKLAYPASLPMGRMVRNLAGANGYSMLVGDFGADGMVVIDPTRADGFTFIQLPARRIAFGLDSKDGDRLFVLVEDGRLLAINPLTGATMAERAVTGRYSIEAGIVRPRLSSAGDMVVVTDPATASIIVVDAATLAELRRIPLEGTPFDVVAVGGTGMKH